MKSDHFNKNNPFSVPEKYFDNLSHRVFSRIQESEKIKKNHSFKSGYYWIAAMVACVVIFFMSKIELGSVNRIDQEMAWTESDSFYQWLYLAETNNFLAGTLEMTDETNIVKQIYSEDDELEIIRFLERDNVNIIAIVDYFNDNE